MTTEPITDEVKVLLQKLKDCINTVKLGAAGRFVGYDKELNMFILYMHINYKKTLEATQLAWDSIPDDLKLEISEAGIGFAGKQI